MGIMKHVGKVGGKPCVILFREIPKEPDNCLVIETSNLSDSDHDALMNVVQSAEGQEAHELSEVLNRRQFSDGSNMLTNLHQNRKINKVSVDMVSMTPNPSASLPLRDVNIEIRKKLAKSNPLLNTQVNPDHLSAKQEKTVDPGTPKEIAAGLLAQSVLLEGDAASILFDAKAKKAAAYAMDPDLVPKRGPGRPPKDE